jgi:hypothetical protein
MNRIWLPSDERAVFTDRFMHCTFYDLLVTSRQTGWKEAWDPEGYDMSNID